MILAVYGINENGNAEVRIYPELHSTLSCGGGASLDKVILAYW